LSVFRKHVGNIVRVIAKEKVCGVYAAWVIAFMENVTAVWNWADVNLIRDAMSKLSAKSAISVLIKRAIPKNAALVGCRTNPFIEAVIE
jgi:hypothetical protein